MPTSGSTGEPKGVLLTAGALRHSAQATHDRLGGPGQWLLALPVTHVAGLTVLVRSLLARTRPEVLDLYGGFDVGAFVAATARLRPGRAATTRRSCRPSCAGCWTRAPTSVVVRRACSSAARP